MSLVVTSARGKHLQTHFAPVLAMEAYILFWIFCQVWSERRWGHGAVNFITGAGGFLQAVIYGYGGFRIRQDGLYFNSTLPSRATKLALRIHYLGSSIDFEVQVGGVILTVVNSGPISPQLEVVTGESAYQLTRGKPVIMEAMHGVVRKHVSRIKNKWVSENISPSHRKLQATLLVTNP